MLLPPDQTLCSTETVVLASTPCDIDNYSTLLAVSASAPRSALTRSKERFMKTVNETEGSCNHSHTPPIPLTVSAVLMSAALSDSDVNHKHKTSHVTGIA